MTNHRGSVLLEVLIGIAALSAWGLYRFNQILAGLPSATGNNLTERLAAQAARVRVAYVMQYGEIFGVTAIVCVVGALLGLLISGRHEHADEPAPAIDADDTPTTLIDAPKRAFDAHTQAISRRPPPDQTVRIQRQPPPDQTVRIQRQPPPGRHRPR